MSLPNHQYALVNADTDSISFAKPDGKAFTEAEQARLIDEINALTPDLIKWEHDGVYEQMLVVKAKNYAWRTGDKIKLKGAALLANYKEPALKKFLLESIRRIMAGEPVLPLYNEIVTQLHEGQIDIKDWASKKTITEKIIKPERTNEAKVLEAITRAGLKPQIGDKVYIYFREDDSLGLVDTWNMDHSKPRLFEKLYKTVKVLEPVLDLTEFLNYKLKKNSKLL